MNKKGIINKYLLKTWHSFSKVLTQNKQKCTFGKEGEGYLSSSSISHWVTLGSVLSL